MRSHLEGLSVRGFEERQWAGAILSRRPLVLVAMRCAKKSARRLLHHAAPDAFIFGAWTSHSSFVHKSACRCKPLCRLLTLVILPYTKRASDACFIIQRRTYSFWGARLHHSASTQKPAGRCKLIHSPLTFVSLPYTKKCPTHASSHNVGRVHFWITLTASRSSKTLPSRRRRATGSAHPHPSTLPR